MFYRFKDDVFQSLIDAFEDFVLTNFLFVFRIHSGSCSCRSFCCESCWVDAWVGWDCECYSSHGKVLGCVDDKSRMTMISSAQSCGDACRNCDEFFFECGDVLVRRLTVDFCN